MPEEKMTVNNGKQKSSTKAKNTFNNKKYDRLYPFVPKGQKEKIAAAAAAAVPPESLNDYIIKAVYERMDREGYLINENEDF